MPCRIQARKVWTTRLLLEASQHAASSFVTLIYDEDRVPEQLVPRDGQLFLKRLRRSVGWPIRFYLVGEYGEKFQRPHFHIALFGLDASLAVALCSRAWSKGFVHVGELNESTARYLCGYVLKKLTSKSDRLPAGKHPEFARMSLRPGIGAAAMEKVGDGLCTDGGSRSLVALGDVPGCVRMERRRRGIGRYLRRVLREVAGLQGNTPAESLRRMEAEQLLRIGADMEAVEVSRIGLLAKADQDFKQLKRKL